MPQLAFIPFRFKIKAQQHILTLTLLLVLVVLTASILVFESSISESVMVEVKTNLEETGEQIESQIQESLSEYRNDVRFLHATPPVSGLPRALNNAGVDPLEHTPYAEWKSRLETIFVAFLQNNSEYQQLRIIDATEQGMELVRADRIGGEIKVIDDVNLQSKKDRDYFTASAQLADREIYMSSVSLNREFGKIDFPYRPMLRLSLPIFDELGHRFGFLIVNINAEQLFHSLQNMVLPPSQLMLTDSEGYFLITPNDKHQFSRDLDPTKSWDKSFQILTQLSEKFSKIVAVEDQKSAYFTLIQKIVVSGDIAQGYVMANILTPQSEVAHLENERRTTDYGFLAALTIMLLFVLIVFYRSMRKNQQLSAAKAQSAAIVGGSQDAIIGIDNDTVVTSWNSAAELLFGYNEEFAKGKLVAELALFQDLPLSEIIEQLAQSNMQQNAEITITKDAQPVYLYLSFSPITDFASGINGVAIIARDITKEHIAEVNIKQANVELEEKVASRTKELQKTSHLKSAFISSISHEMRTPLNGIIGTLKLVKNESLSDSQQRYLEMTEVSVNNLSALINDVLDLSKIEAGKLDVDFKAFNPIKLIENLCCNMAIKAQENGLEFIIDVVDLHCQSIVSDAHRFSQILSNLISNAIKFTETGYVKVSASSELDNNGQVILYCSVTDSGAGIAEHNQDKLFTAFTQEYTAVASKYGGTGLGLAICRQLIELLNGEINFTSVKDKGSTFSFSITVPQVDCKQMFVEPSLQGKSCLILVSHDESYKNIQRMFESRSGEVLAPNPYEDWLLFENKNCPDITPDFIIIDQQDSKIANLDKKWSQWGATPAPEVFVLMKNGGIELTLENIVAAQLNKPILLADFLQKALEHTDESFRKNALLNQQETEDNFHTSAENLSKITGARILIVDDNEINLEVAKGMLADLPIEIDQAMDGQEALGILQQSVEQNQVIHCILMDCQMPILNGYDTSRQIRQGAVGRQYRTIPIIAMTANAMLGEKEKCLEAGMSDYTTKPINPDLLVLKITEWILTAYQAPLQIRKQAPVNHTDDTQPQNTSAEVATPETLEWDKRAALTRLMNNEALLSKICQIFMDTSPKKIEALGQAIAQKNVDTIVKLTHSLKGSAGDVGAANLHQLFSAMEQLAKIPNMEKLDQHYQTVLTRYASFISILKNHQGNEL